MQKLFALDRLLENGPPDVPLGVAKNPSAPALLLQGAARKKACSVRSTVLGGF
jgi:hypothetical protein